MEQVDLLISLGGHFCRKKSVPAAILRGTTGAPLARLQREHAFPEVVVEARREDPLRIGKGVALAIPLSFHEPHHLRDLEQQLREETIGGGLLINLHYESS